MRIGDFDFERMAVFPYEAHTIPVVDTYAVLALPIALELFKLKTRTFQVNERRCSFELE